MKKNILTFLVLLCSVFMKAQSVQKNDLNELFNELEAENKAMGAISIRENGKEVYQKFIGFSNLKDKKEANEFTKYRVGSITKTFTATIILQLIDEGKLSLDTLLSNYFPEMPNANNITIEHLLYHRSGLYNVTREENFHVWISKSRSRKEMVAKFIKNGVDFQPGEKMAYSNTNYILLSYIAEDIDKIKFSKILQNRISKPLRLKRTLFGKEIKPNKNEAISYYKKDAQWLPIQMQTNLNGTMGAGSVVSTPKELTAFYSNLFSNKIIPETLLKKMMTQKEGMGMGISVFKFKGLSVYGHDGGIDGFRSMAAYIPKKKISIAFTFNASNISSRVTLIQILEAYFSNDESLQSKSLITLKSKDLDVYLGRYEGATSPLKITVTKKNATLFAQATGQPIFELIAIKKDVFKYDAMGIVFSFKSAEKQVLVKFQGKGHLLTKE